MSEEKKQQEEGGPAAPAEGLPVAAGPAMATLEAAKGAMAQVPEAGPPPADVSVPDDRELEAWNEQVRRRMRQKSRRSFLGWGAGLLAGIGAFRWLTTRREIDGVPWPFRKTLEVNEQLARDYFSTGRPALAFAPDRVSADRVNGDLGLGDDVDVATWKLEIQGLASQDEPLRLGLDAIKKLPRTQMTTEFKCIEGWSAVVQWSGARFADFMKAYPPQTRSGGDFSLDNPEDLPPYVSMATPDGGYYVGLDMESMLHAQTLLCYERNGAPLSEEHGAPLRLVIPVKYGVKNLKRIGTIRYST
ncbi:MAG TPA: molybdopterin-dependent oxidoreductase, partial [Candidatus Methylomirabilis sp.]|nr:molybdopterin-dependent oxidoreductase [Candidatus Methylomirabilis sp.]